MERKIIVPVKCLKGGEQNSVHFFVPVKCLKGGNKTVYISNIKNSLLWNHAKIFQNNMNKT